MAILDDETMKAWDAYVDSRCTAIVDAVIDEAGEFVAEREQAIRDDFHNVRESMLRELRGNLVDVFREVLSEMGLDESDDDNVIDVPDFRGKRDATAG